MISVVDSVHLSLFPRIIICPNCSELNFERFGDETAAREEIDKPQVVQLGFLFAKNTRRFGALILLHSFTLYRSLPP